MTATGVVTGGIVGLVLITPSAGFVEPIGALCIGLIGCALVSPTFQINHLLADDSLDAFPCHGVGGFVGTCLVGLFAREGGLFYGGGWHLLGAQIASAVATATYA